MRLCLQVTPILSRAFALSLVGFVLAATSPQARSDASFTVSKVKSEGTFEVTFVAGNAEISFPFMVSKANGMLPSEEDVAKQIEDRFRRFLGDPTRRNAAIIMKEIRLTNGRVIKNVSFRFQSNDIIDAALDQGNFAALPGAGAGILTFLPNPVTGRATLFTDATVSAGFSEGLDPISFDAVMDTPISELTSLLKASLDVAGYQTRSLGLRGVEVLADGVGIPTEMFFSLIPKEPIGSEGIVIQLTPVPELSSFALFISVMCLVTFIGVRRRRVVGAPECPHGDRLLCDSAIVGVVVRRVRCA